MDELADEVLFAMEASPNDPAERLRAVVRGTVEFSTRTVDEDGVLYVEGLGNEALNIRHIRRIEAGRAVVAFIERYTAERSQTPPGDEQIGRVGATVLVGGFNQLLVDWLAGRVRVGGTS